MNRTTQQPLAQEEIAFAVDAGALCCETELG